MSKWFIFTITFYLLLSMPLHAAESVTVERFEVGASRTNCYILQAPSRRESLVIDPGDDAPRILSAATRNHCRLRHILLTHGHPDHLGACKSLYWTTQATVWIAAEDLPFAQNQWSGIPVKVLPPDFFESGPFRLEILKTPGHTAGSVCFRWNNILFSGDTLFHQAYGQCKDARIIAQSINGKLWPFDAQTLVYPGHGPSTTIGVERTSNPINELYRGKDISAIPWVELYPEAQVRAKKEKMILVLLLTVNAWPCARGYCDQTLKDGDVAGLMSKTVNCRVDVSKNPEFKAKYQVSTPDQLPAFAFLDENGVLLDLLKKPSTEMLHESLGQVLSGVRPLEQFEEINRKPRKLAEDYLALASYLETHNRLAESVKNLEEARASTDLTQEMRRTIEWTLLEQYPRMEKNEEALKIADSLLATTASLSEEQIPAIIFKKATIFYSQKKYSDCLQLLRQIRIRYADTIELGNLYLVSALCYLATGEYDTAHETLDKVSAPVEAEAKALYLKGYCHLLEQQYGDASNDFRQLLAKHPGSEYARQAEDFLIRLKDTH